MQSKYILAISNLVMPLIITLARVQYPDTNTNFLKFFESNIIIFILFILTITSIIMNIFIIVSINKASPNTIILKIDDAKILDENYAVKIFELWFLIISPLIIFSPSSKIEMWLLLFTILIIIKIIAKSNYFAYNVVLIILNYNFFKVEIGRQKKIIITKKDYSEVNDALISEKKIFCELYDDYLILK